MCLLYTVVLCLCYLAMVQGRKYDIQAEAIKLYGEELDTVIKRFRRSPEYLAILKEKVAEVKGDIRDMKKQIIEAYKKKLEEKIIVLIPDSEETQKIENKPDRRYRRSRYKSYLRGLQLNRRQEEVTVLTENSTTTTTLSPVQLLDQFVPEHKTLTVAEGNHYKDLGFEYAGNAIHFLIKNTGEANKEEDANWSTRMPKDTETTGFPSTKHDMIHKVTPEEEETVTHVTTTDTEDTPSLAGLRFKQQENRRTTKMLKGREKKGRK